MKEEAVEPSINSMVRCKVCGGLVIFNQETAWNGTNHDVVNSWWSHLGHPNDNHNAVPGPSTNTMAQR